MKPLCAAALWCSLESWSVCCSVHSCSGASGGSSLYHSLKGAVCTFVEEYNEKREMLIGCFFLLSRLHKLNKQTDLKGQHKLYCLILVVCGGP